MSKLKYANGNKPMTEDQRKDMSYRMSSQDLIRMLNFKQLSHAIGIHVHGQIWKIVGEIKINQ